MVKLMRANLASLLMILFGIMVLVIIPFEVRSSGSEAFGPRFLPYAVAVMVILLSIISLFEKGIQRNSGKGLRLSKGDYLRLLAVLFAMIAWFLITPLIGFIISTIIFTAGVMFMIGNRKLPQLILVPIILTAIIYYVFNELLSVILPTNSLF